MNRFSHFRFLPLLLCCPTTSARPVISEEATIFLEDHCFDCHDDATTKGGLDLMSLDFDSSDASNLAIWTHVHDRIASGEMPPEKKPRPAADEIEIFSEETSDFLLGAFHDFYKENGRTIGRRLNPTEYEYTLRDLLKTPWLELKDILPPDPESHGFDNVADAQEISYIQMAQFLEAAGIAIDYAMQLRPRKKPSTVKVDFSGFVRLHGKGELAGKGGNDARVVGDWTAFIRQPNSAQAPYSLPGSRQKEAGWYKIRVRCRAARFHNGELIAPTQTHVATMNTASKRILATFEVPSDPDGGIVEFVAFQHEDEELQFHCTSLDDRNGPSVRRFPITHPYSTESIAVDYFEIEGPYSTEDCESNVGMPDGYRVLFGDLPTKPWTEDSGLREPELLHRPDLTADSRGLEDPYRQPGGKFMVISENPLEDAERLLRDFMEKAYRHPVEESEFQRCFAFAKGSDRRKSLFPGCDAPRLQGRPLFPGFSLFFGKARLTHTPRYRKPTFVFPLALDARSGTGSARSKWGPGQ